MKKILFTLSALLIGFASCTGPMGPQGPQGPSGKDGNANWIVTDFKIFSADWVSVFDKNGNFLLYEYIFDYEDLNDFVYNNRAYLAYIEVVEGNTKIQRQLPYTITHETDGVLWEQRIASDYANGSIRFYVVNTDFRDNRPDDMLFRVVLL
ncbi:MAG: hypothetical protein LBH80_04315 [Prevotellaceae bacterium]|jgi:hypothetical protein|nr:hypothetical protein [Prevotellaceae bacterium]